MQRWLLEGGYQVSGFYKCTCHTETAQNGCSYFFSLVQSYFTWAIFTPDFTRGGGALWFLF